MEQLLSLGGEHYQPVCLRVVRVIELPQAQPICETLNFLGRKIDNVDVYLVTRAHYPVTIRVLLSANSHDSGHVDGF